MNGYQSTFKRVEKKYLLNEKQYMDLRQSLEGHMLPDQFAKTTICNIYFDTPDSRLIRTSLEKPVYKEKLRLRSYGVPENDSKVFVELKKKLKGVVFKRRTDMSYRQAQAYLYNGVRPEKRQKSSEEQILNEEKRILNEEEQILNEIDWFLHFYGTVEPAMYLSYDRCAFCGKEDGQLRMTFDTNIRYRTEALSLAEGIWGKELLEPGQRLLEIKIPGAMPLWLSQRMSELEIYPASFSKYGKAYMETLMETMPETAHGDEIAVSGLVDQVAMTRNAGGRGNQEELTREEGGRICA